MSAIIELGETGEMSMEELSWLGERVPVARQFWQLVVLKMLNSMKIDFISKYIYYGYHFKALLFATNC